METDMNDDIKNFCVDCMHYKKVNNSWWTSLLYDVPRLEHICCHPEQINSVTGEKFESPCNMVRNKICKTYNWFKRKN